ncbi:hypothetical protein GCM10010415_08080 [Streptomyces atrovirens]
MSRASLTRRPVPVDGRTAAPTAAAFLARVGPDMGLLTGRPVGVARGGGSSTGASGQVPVCPASGTPLRYGPERDRSNEGTP